MPETRDTPVRRDIERFLGQAYGSAEVDGDGDFVMHRGSAVTWVRVQAMDDRHTAVIVFSPAAIGLRVDGDLTRFLATEDLDLDFAHFELHDRTVPMAVVSHTLLGEYLSREELTTVVEEVSSTAGRYGPRITERFGGWGPGRPPAAGAPGSLANPWDEAGGTADGPRPAALPAFRVGANSLALVGGLVAALLAHGRTASWWVAVFVFTMVVYVVGFAVPEVATGAHRWRRAGALALVPLTAVAVVALTYWWWERWWLSVPLGMVLGLLGGATLAVILVPDLAGNEPGGAKAGDRRSYLAGGLG